MTRILDVEYSRFKVICGVTVYPTSNIVMEKRMGNLMGNTWDYFLYRFSFGSWDPTERGIDI